MLKLNNIKRRIKQRLKIELDDMIGLHAAGMVRSMKLDYSCTCNDVK